jgi:hypothetical protein
MSHPGLVERLLSEVAAARAAIAASYERLWPAAERTLQAPQADERHQPDASRDDRPAPMPGDDRSPAGE